jgi:uncharacterized protein YndB with AHSA1/START domain
MPTDTHAILRELEGRSALCFERALPYPPERIWRALTVHDELFNWHPTPFELEPVAGGAITYRPAPGGPEMPAGTVLAYDPPRRLAYTWGEDELRWELHPHDGGCLLSLTHLFDDPFKAARDGAGWHLCLRALSSSLAGKAAPQRGEGPRLPSDWEGLNGEYQERFGISPEQATPVPEI